MSDGTRRLVIYAGDDSGVRWRRIAPATCRRGRTPGGMWRWSMMQLRAYRGVWRCYLDGDCKVRRLINRRVSVPPPPSISIWRRIGGNPVTFCGYLDCWRVSCGRARTRAVSQRDRRCDRRDRRAGAVAAEFNGRGLLRWFGRDRQLVVRHTVDSPA